MRTVFDKIVTLTGIQPVTFCLGNKCSMQLSYKAVTSQQKNQGT